MEKSKVPKQGLTEDVVYRFVCRHPGMSTYEISKKLNMTGGRVRHALIKLKQKKLINFKFEKDSNNPRIKKLTYPINAWYLLPKSLKRELNNMVNKK